MEPPRAPSWSALWRYVAGAAVCALLAAVSFGGGGRRVPLLEWIDLAAHEFGHVAAAALPDLATAMAGSVAQVTLPLAIAAYFLLRGEHVGAMLCLAWGGTSARDASVYIADAPDERLELIGGLHDWAFALGPEGLDRLESAGAIAAGVRGAGLVAEIAAISGCLAGPVLARRRDPRAGAGAATEP